MPGQIFVLLLVFIVVGLPVVCGTVLSLAKVDKGKKGHRRGSKLDDEETRIMQELHQGLSRLEKRIEALETIIIEKK